MRSALWGGVALGVGTLAYALLSSSSASCSTNLVVLTHSVVTARGCAAFSIVSHIGIGLMVLGAVLLLGSFALAVRTRRQSAVATGAPGVGHAATGPSVPGVGDEQARLFEPDAVSSTASASPVASSIPAPSAPVPAPVVPAAGAPTTPPEAVEPVELVHAHDGDARLPGPASPAVRLPPGWYGNPNAPGKPVQWWDGTKLTDHREG
ncbi:MAG: hypothetical protein ABSB09_02480 [Acidimicrobiales bacterium]|jgi:hypothetical protein